MAQLLNTRDDGGPGSQFLDQFGGHADFEHVLELGRLAAVRVHRNMSCIEHHKECLKERGETEQRLREIHQWRRSSVFTEREKAALALSESFSLDQTTEETFAEARRHLSISEMVRLILAVTAVNDWISLHPEPPVRVLVVDDNLDDQELLRRQLKRTPMAANVVFVFDAFQALDLLSGPRGDAFRQELVAIFLDINMPGMTGIELLRQIRNISGMEDFPVIMLTSSNDPGDIAECERLKVASYVQKPVTFSSFSHSVANIFHRSRADLAV